MSGHHISETDLKSLFISKNVMHEDEEVNVVTQSKFVNYSGEHRIAANRGVAEFKERLELVHVRVTGTPVEVENEDYGDKWWRYFWITARDIFCPSKMRFQLRLYTSLFLIISFSCFVAALLNHEIVRNHFLSKPECGAKHELAWADSLQIRPAYLLMMKYEECTKEHVGVFSPTPELRSYYKRLVFCTHPDKGGNSEDSFLAQALRAEELALEPGVLQAAMETVRLKYLAEKFTPFAEICLVSRTYMTGPFDFRFPKIQYKYFLSPFHLYCYTYWVFELLWITVRLWSFVTLWRNYRAYTVVYSDTEPLDFTYCPHLATCVLQEYERGTDEAAVLASLKQKMRRLAALPIPSADHLIILDGTAEVVLHAIRNSTFFGGRAACMGRPVLA